MLVGALSGESTSITAAERLNGVWTPRLRI